MKDFFEKYADRIIPEPNTGCWIWEAAVASAGYGHGTRNRTHFYAHRSAYESVHGDGSALGRLVRHTCDFPPCCNPEHLQIGTQVENMEDMRVRGRRNDAQGERASKSKLKEADVFNIRAMAAARKTVQEIRITLGLSHLKWDTIKKAATGETWPHILGAVPNYAGKR